LRVLHFQDREQSRVESAQLASKAWPMRNLKRQFLHNGTRLGAWFEAIEIFCPLWLRKKTGLSKQDAPRYLDAELGAAMS
jgi:hypothetical protein